jgi:site-specific recombinase XerD
MTAKSFHTLIARLGERAGMAFPIHPHMLRHGCGYALANAGHDTRSIQAGQVRELLDFLLALTSSFEGFATRPTAASYS